VVELSSKIAEAVGVQLLEDANNIDHWAFSYRRIVMSEGIGKRGLTWQTSQDATQDAKKTQLESINTTATDQHTIPVVAETVQTKSIDEILLKQASKFMEDPSIKDAPLDRKIAFLETKGVSKENVRKVLDTPRSDVKPLLPQTLQPQVRHEVPSASANVITHDIPPIITYPEFLMKSKKPPPIITAQRLLGTAYAFGGAATIIYGLSKYLIGPMADSLTFARHEFAEHSQNQIAELNSKLKELVSVDPAVYMDPAAKTGDDTASIADSLDYDPTELYHRDFGTQTLPLPASSDTSSSADGEEIKDASLGNGTENQASHLLLIKNRFEELRSEYDVEEQSTYAEVSTVVKVLNEHLESLAYPTNSYHGIYGGGDGGKKDDEIGRVKAEIRGVKGVLLSARNFKAPVRGTFGTSTSR